MDNDFYPYPQVKPVWQRVISVLSVSLAAMLAFILVVFSIIIFIAYLFLAMPPIEKTYQEVEQLYIAYRETGEQLYGLMLPFATAQSATVKSYRSNGDYSQWQGDTAPLVKELEALFAERHGYLVGAVVNFTLMNESKWCLNIYLGAVHEYLMHLSYYPYDELPYSHSRQLEGMAYGWSFIAEAPP